MHSWTLACVYRVLEWNRIRVRWCKLQLECHDTDVTLLGHVPRLVFVLCLRISAVPIAHRLGTPGTVAEYTANFSHTYAQRDCVEWSVCLCVFVMDRWSQMQPSERSSLCSTRAVSKLSDVSELIINLCYNYILINYFISCSNNRILLSVFKEV